MKNLARVVILGSMFLFVIPPAVMAEQEGLAPQAGSWFTQNGPIAINFKGKSEVRVNGVRIRGAEAEPDDDFTFSSAYGYHFTPNISAQLVLGVTTETDVTNQDGALLGEIAYGAPSIVVDYRINRFGAIQPFAGVGAMYLYFFDEEGDALSKLKVDDTAGLILRAGAEVMLNHRFGGYFAANKIFIETDAHARLGANKVDANLELDPWIFQAGVTYRF